VKLTHPDELAANRDAIVALVRAASTLH
jgi:hypothetical protein